MRVKKILLSFCFLLVTAVLVICLWHWPILLIAGIIFTAYIKHMVLPIKKELLWFILVGFLGSLLENIIIYSGAWHYPQTFFMYVPAWLPFLWGIAGTTAIPLYEGLFTKKGR